MTTSEAIRDTLTSVVYDAIRPRSSPPEMLKLAAIHCFTYPVLEGITTPREQKIREAMKVLFTTGEFSE